MNIKEMHFDFKMKLNKIDSQQFRNLRIPEIDWKLNEAQELFVKLIAEPRVNNNNLGFELLQRNTDDIRTLVTYHCGDVVDNVFKLPDNYWFFIKGDVFMTKGNCKNVKGRLKVRQHDDMFEESPFDNSSFEWREVNCTFFEEGIKLYDDGTFKNNSACIHYIKKLPYIHNAEDFTNGRYKLPGRDVILEGVSNCILPETTHREIVDIAVKLTIEDIVLSQKHSNFDKLKFTQITT